MNDLGKNHPQEVIQDKDRFTVPPKDTRDSTQILHRPFLRHSYVVVITFILIFGAGLPVIWLGEKPFHITRGAIVVAPVFTDLLTGKAGRGEISSYELYMNTQARLMTNNRVLQGVAVELDDKDMEIFGSEADLFKWLQNALKDEIITVAPIRNTEWMEISMKSRNSSEAEQIVNAIIDEYMEVIQNASMGREDKQLAALENKRDELLKKLNLQRQKLQDLSQEGGRESLLNLQAMANESSAVLGTELTNLKIRRLNLQTRINELLPVGDPNILLAAVIEERNEYINDHPLVQQETFHLMTLGYELRKAQQQAVPKSFDILQKNRLINKTKEILRQYREQAGKEFNTIMAPILKNRRKYDLDRTRKELEQVELLIQEFNEQLEQEKNKALELGQKQFQMENIKVQMTFDENLYHQTEQRIGALEMESFRPVRISIADRAHTGPLVNKRTGRLTALVILALVYGVFLALLMSKVDGNKINLSLWLVVLSSSVVAVCSFLAAIKAYSSQEWLAIGLCLTASAVSGGLLANALLRRQTTSGS
ncbi:hypothetical protein ACFL02_04785 [Planctomycetota bacterium]